MQKSTILVIADVAPIIFTLQQFLTEQGFKVVNSKSAEKALAMLSSDPSIEIVICDLAIRGANGVDLLRDARRITRMNDEGPLPPPKFIFMSAPRSYASVAERQLREKATLMSDGHVIDKPLDKEDLLRRIQQLGSKAIEVKPIDMHLRNSSSSSYSYRGANDSGTVEAVQEQQKRLDGEIIRLDTAHKELSQRMEQLHARLSSLEEGVGPTSAPRL